MHINDTTRQMIREIVVELFKETLETNPTEDKEVIQLADTLDDIIKNRFRKWNILEYWR